MTARMYFTRPGAKSPAMVKVDRAFATKARRKLEGEGWKLEMVTWPVRGKKRMGR